MPPPQAHQRHPAYQQWAAWGMPPPMRRAAELRGLWGHGGAENPPPPPAAAPVPPAGRLGRGAQGGPFQIRIEQRQVPPPGIPPPPQPGIQGVPQQPPQQHQQQQQQRQGVPHVRPVIQPPRLHVGPRQPQNNREGPQMPRLNPPHPNHPPQLTAAAGVQQRPQRQQQHERQQHQQPQPHQPPQADDRRARPRRDELEFGPPENIRREPENQARENVDIADLDWLLDMDMEF